MPDWIFQAVPKTYDLVAALRDKVEDTWTARQRPQDMAPGQSVYFWLGAPVGGIIAVGQITGRASEEASPPDQQEYWRANAGKRKSAALMRVPVRYERKFPLHPLVRATLSRFPELARQSPIGGFYAATNFALSPEAAARLRAIVAAHHT